MKKINIFTGNKIYLYDDFGVVVLRNNKSKIVGKCKIDLKDLDKISEHKWGLGHGYAVTTNNGETISMHRFLIIKGDNEKVIHHINRDRLDNRKKNLKILSSKGEHASEHNKNRKVCPNIIDCRTKVTKNVTKNEVGSE